MPVNPVRESRAAGQLARDLLWERLRTDVGCSKADPALLADGRGELSMVPVYSIAVERLRQKRFDKGWRSGWRYFWTHPEMTQGATVEIRRRANTPQIVRYGWGPGAVHVVRLFDALGPRFAKDPCRYRPRLLRLAPIGVEAAWLNTDDPAQPDHFVGLQPELEGDELMDVVMKRLQDKFALERRPPTESLRDEGLDQ
jgi:hypothetical protein